MQVDATERAVRLKMTLFVVVPLFALYAFFALDRGNVGFAATHLSRDLGLSATAYGLGASLFTLSYLAGQVPIVMAMKRMGAARAIGLVAAAFGSVSAATALVWDETSFFAVRFLLGFAEAGFGSFVVYYINLIMPSSMRGTALSMTLLAVPIVMIVASPLSGPLLAMDHFGLHGWQWLFILEGVPAVLLGLLCFFVLPSGADKARFLNDGERAWLTADLQASETKKKPQTSVATTWDAVRSPTVWVLGIVLLATVLGNNTLVFWMPQMIQLVSGADDVSVGWLNAVPWISFALGMILLGRASDRINRKTWGVAMSMSVAAAGYLLGASDQLTIAFIGLIIGAFGAGATMGIFWTVPMQLLSGAGLVSAFAVINMIGNSSGIFAHWLIGWLRDHTGGFGVTLIGLAVTLLIAATILVVFGDRRGERASADPGAAAIGH